MGEKKENEIKFVTPEKLMVGKPARLSQGDRPLFSKRYQPLDEKIVLVTHSSGPRILTNRS